MGKKDTQGTQVSTGEHHRKQVGKENLKKAKKDNKDAKKKTDLKKSSMPIKDVILVLVSFLAMIASVYLFFYWYLEQPTENKPSQDL